MDDTSIIVKPVEGATLPLEGSRRRIDRPMRVPNSEYIRRALARGDIARATEREVELAIEQAERATTTDGEA